MGQGPTASPTSLAQGFLGLPIFITQSGEEGVLAWSGHQARGIAWETVSLSLSVEVHSCPTVMGPGACPSALLCQEHKPWRLSGVEAPVPGIGTISTLRASVSPHGNGTTPQTPRAALGANALHGKAPGWGAAHGGSLQVSPREIRVPPGWQACNQDGTMPVPAAWPSRPQRLEREQEAGACSCHGARRGAQGPRGVSALAWMPWRAVAAKPWGPVCAGRARPLPAAPSFGGMTDEEAEPPAKATPSSLAPRGPQDGSCCSSSPFVGVSQALPVPQATR